MSRNYQLHTLFANEASAVNNAAERAEMHAQDLSTIDQDPPRITTLSCEGCFQSWHYDSVYTSKRPLGWACPACSTFHEL